MKLKNTLKSILKYYNPFIGYIDLYGNHLIFNRNQFKLIINMYFYILFVICIFIL